MLSKAQQSFSNTVAVLLRPLVRVLLRNGVSYGVFAELARKSYVDVAFADFGEAGRKQTISRVAALTGLTRKEVKRLYETEEVGGSDAHQRFNRAVRVVSGWAHDQRFTDAQGHPAALPMTGADSFSQLVKDYSGDMPVKAMLSVLVSAGTVNCADDEVQLLHQAYVPSGMSLEKVQILGTDAAELISTVAHNLETEVEDLRYQRKVSYDSVPMEAVAKFKKLSARKSQALLEELNNWLVKHHNDETSNTGSNRRVSVGIYYFEDDPENES